jgi:hypothetical protein
LFFATSIASACRVWIKSVSKDMVPRRRPTREAAGEEKQETSSFIAA